MAVPDPSKPDSALPGKVPGWGADAPLAGADFLDPLFGTDGDSGGFGGEHGRDVALLGPARKPALRRASQAASDGPGFETGRPGLTTLAAPAGDPSFSLAFETPPEAEFFAEQVLSGEPGPFTPIDFSFFTPFVASAGVTLIGGGGQTRSPAAPTTMCCSAPAATSSMAAAAMISSMATPTRIR